MLQHMPGDLVIRNPREEFGTGIAVRVNKGPSRTKPSRCGPVIRSLPGWGPVALPAYPESRLKEIIEQGNCSPREIPDHLIDRVERERVADKEDHRILEQQYAGFASTGTFGSLDGRNSKRSTKNKTEAQS
jgi:hypothetical protein